MSTAVRIERPSDDGVVELVIDVEEQRANVLSFALVDAIEQALDAITELTDVEALVVRSDKPQVFLTGPDLAEVAAFDDASIAVGCATRGQSCLSRLGRQRFPVIAAVDGACLGGGLELALACTYRLASRSPETRFGAPEVALGLIPSYGGTQRLPRLIGVRHALEIIVDGRDLDAVAAHAVGLVDELVAGDGFAERAVDRVGEIVQGRRPKRRRRAIFDVACSAVGPLRDLYLLYTDRRIERGTRGLLPAPTAAVASIREGMRRALDDALEVEAGLAGGLAVSPECKGLVRTHLLATRLARRPGIDATQARATDRVGVCGATEVGATIAAQLISHGVTVSLQGGSLQELRVATQRARESLAAATRRATGVDVEELMMRLSPTVEGDGFGRAAVVVDASGAALALRRSALASIEEQVGSDTIIAMSGDDLLSELSSSMECPERLVGMHFPGRVDRTELVEVVFSDRTGEAAVATVVALVRRIGKLPLLVRDGPGQIVSRIRLAGFVEAVDLLRDGVDGEQVDQALTDFGMALGPFADADSVGLVRMRYAFGLVRARFPERFPPLPLLDALVESGLTGRDGGGFYDYRGRRPRANRRVLDLLRATGSAVRRGARARGAIQERVVFAMLNEAMHALEDRIVGSAAACDLACILGLGFPAFRGGLLAFASSLGIDQVIASLERLETEHGERFRIAPRIVALSRAGQTFVDA